MRQKGIALIYLLIGLVVLTVAFLVPIPSYQNQVLCIPCPEKTVCPPCKPGWHLSDPLWKKIASYFSSANKPVEKTIIVSPPSTPTPSTTSNSNPLSTNSANITNWKTYTDGKTYNIQLPQDFSLSEVDSATVGYISSRYFFSKNGAELYIDVEKDAYEKIKKQAADSFKPSFQPKQLSISDINWLIVYEGSAGEAGRSYRREVLAQNGENTIHIIFNTPYITLEKPDMSLFDQILSTFKFLP